MPYEIVEHMADVKVRVWGKTLEEVFRSALEGMNSIMAPSVEGGGEGAEREIEVDSSDRSSLLVDFLNEVLSLSQINKEVYTDVTFGECTETHVQATLVGTEVEEFDEDIKAVTYHTAELKESEEYGLEATLVFDI
jgi:SHS2 domain-containing protein